MVETFWIVTDVDDLIKLKVVSQVMKLIDSFIQLTFSLFTYSRLACS